MRERARRLAIWLSKLAVSAGLLAYLFSARISLAEVRAALARPDWWLLAATLLVYGASAAAGAVQWTWLLRAAGVRAGRRGLHRLYLIGLFFNNFLPANVGGDAVKIVDLGRQEGRPLKVFCATLLDRLLGLCSLTLLALIAVAAAALRMDALPPVYPLLLAMLVWLALLTALLSRRVSSRLPALLRRARWEAAAARLEGARAEFALYRSRPAWIVGVFAFSLGVQVLRVLTHLLAARALGVSLSGDQALQLFVLVPLLGILVALPISVNGIGLRESMTAVLFTRAGFQAGDAVAFELVAFAAQVAFSLLGGVLFLGGGARRARRAASGAPGNRGEPGVVDPPVV